MPSGQFSIRVQPTLDPPGLRLRAQPTTASNTLAFEAPGTVLTVLEAEGTARAKLGVYNQWIQVRDANALEGYVAAWYVEVAPAAAATPAPAPAVSTPSSTPTAPTVKAPNAQALVDAINAERTKRGVA